MLQAYARPVRRGCRRTRCPAGRGGERASGPAGHGWSVPHLPKVPAHANWSNLYGVALDGSSVYAVGTFVNPSTDNNQVLLLKGTGGTWSIVGAPNAGGSGGGDIPGGITNVDGHLWIAGTYTTATSNNLPLIERH